MWSSERAKMQLKKEGRTTAWLAEFCGLKNVKQINHYLAGRRVPKRPVIKLMAMALNTTEEFLMGEDVEVHHTSVERRAIGV